MCLKAGATIPASSRSLSLISRTTETGPARLFLGFLMSTLTNGSCFWQWPLTPDLIVSSQWHNGGILLIVPWATSPEMTARRGWTRSQNVCGLQRSSRTHSWIQTAFNFHFQISQIESRRIATWAVRLDGGNVGVLAAIQQLCSRLKYVEGTDLNIHFIAYAFIESIMFLATDVRTILVSFGNQKWHNQTMTHFEATSTKLPWTKNCLWNLTH